MVRGVNTRQETASTSEGSPLLGLTSSKYSGNDGNEEAWVATTSTGTSGRNSLEHSSSDSTLSHSFSDSSSDDCEAARPVLILGLGDDDDDDLKKKKHQSVWQRIDKGAWQFALRMAVLLSLSSLFVLVRTEDYHFPDGMWVLVSVLFVCWFPALDAASVIEKIVQRLIGTFVGAFLGLSCGFASIFLFGDDKSRRNQSIFLEACMFFFIFGIIFTAGQAKVGTVKVIRKFAYATILCVLTFCICMLPFAVDDDPKWKNGVWRVVNVIVGCLLGALGAIVICPKSTTDVLHDKAARQVKMAGDAAEAVLHTASEFFAGKINVNRLADDILETQLDTVIQWKFLRSDSLRSNASADTTARADIALKKYEEAIADWRLSKMLFPLANYDPFHLSKTDKYESSVTQMELARTLARALRIQTTIVVMDGMVRNDADYEFRPNQLALFAETGTLIKRMLTVPLHVERSDEAAKRLFLALEEARKCIVAQSTAVSGLSDFEDLRDIGLKDFQKNLLNTPKEFFISSRTAGDENGRGIPRDVTGRHDNTLFFLQLVEHLILRSLRLYQAWKHVEPYRNPK